MFDESRVPSPLAEIKTHVDAHGVGSAVIGDHVAIGLSGRALGPDAPMERIFRVRSLAEARRILGCHRLVKTQ